jgi:hypothetical protein
VLEPDSTDSTVARIRVAALGVDTMIAASDAPYVIDPVVKERPSYPSPPWAPGTACKPLPWLPDITCRVELKSREPVHDREAAFSSLYIVWFQEEFVFPIDAQIIKQIQAIEWDLHATDGYV